MKRSSANCLAVAILTATTVWGWESPYLSESLQVWYRADLGLETNAVGGVARLRNQGRLGADLDLQPNSDNSAGGVKYVAAAIGGQPVLRFDGSVALQASAVNTLGLTAEGGAWFVVYRPTKDGANIGVFGGVNSSSGQRFGGFCPNGATGKIRPYMFSGVASEARCTDAALAKNAAQLLTMTTWKESGVTYGYSMKDAYQTEGRKNVSSVAPGTGCKLSLGAILDLTWASYFEGDIAELRIYNKPMTMVERTRIQLELCARYGLAWAGLGAPAAEAVKWYENGDVFGQVPDTGVPLAETPQEAVGGPATLKIEGAVPLSLSSGSYFAYNGLEHPMVRCWYVSRSAAMGNYPLTLSFDRSACSSDGDFLWRRATDADAWVKVECTREIVGDRLVFHLGKDWPTGYLRIATESDSFLSAWFRADVGVETNASGEVTAWRNQGTYVGANYDLQPVKAEAAAGFAGRVGEADGFRSVVFDGNGYYETAVRTLFDCNTAGGVWFVVFKADPVLNMGIFGADSHWDAAEGAAGADKFARHGAFFADAANAGRLNCYFYSHASSYTPLRSGWNVVSCTEWPKDRTEASLGSAMIRGIGNGTGTQTQNGGAFYGAWGSKFRIGHMVGPTSALSFIKPFVGEIAEVRIYSRQMSAAERARIEAELAARYSIPVATAGMERVPPSGASQDIRVIGQQAQTVAQNQARPESDASGELTLSFAEPVAVDSDTITYFSHTPDPFDLSRDMECESGRSWFVSSMAPGRAFRLAFAAEVDPKCDYRLVWRSALDGGRWRRIASAVVGDGRLAFELGNGFPAPCGYLAVQKRPPRGMCVIIR